MKPNPPQYSKDWHYCTQCGCLMPERMLVGLEVLDEALKVPSTHWHCRDAEYCARMKAGREEILARERRGELADIERNSTRRRKAGT